MAASWRKIGAFRHILRRIELLRGLFRVDSPIISRSHVFPLPVRSRLRGLLLAIPFVPVVGALGFGRSLTEKKPSDSKAEVAQLITEADRLYTTNDFLALYDLLKLHENEENDELLWRLARAACDKGKMATDLAEKRKLMYEAYGHVKRALALNDNNFASHKWYAIMLDYVGEYEGTKQRIANAFMVKEHFLKAIELKPNDPTSVHCLGYWCFVFADMPWYQQKVASVLFATPPRSSYDEALGYFLQAESIEPNFYSINHLMLGKCYIRLKNMTDAKLYLNKAKNYPVKTEDDKRAQKEATDLLKTLKD